MSKAMVTENFPDAFADRIWIDGVMRYGVWLDQPGLGVKALPIVDGKTVATAWASAWSAIHCPWENPRWRTRRANMRKRQQN